MSNRIVTRDEIPRPFLHRVFCLVGLRRPIVQLSKVEQHAVARWATGRKQAVELGVAEGGSAYLIANALDPAGKLTLVDPFFPGGLRWIGLHELIARRLLRGAKPEVRFLKLLSWEAAGSLTAPTVDFLFVDADHSTAAVRRDWDAWMPLLAPDSVVLFHDAIDPVTGDPVTDGPGVVVRDLLTQGWECAEIAGRVAVIRRASAGAASGA